MEPPLRVERDEPEPPDIHRYRARTSVARKHPDVAPSGHRCNHPLLQPDRVQSEWTLTGPIVVPGKENAAGSERNRVDLRLEPAPRIRIFGLTFRRNSVGINVVAEERDDAATRRGGRLRGEGIQNAVGLARIGLARVANQEQRRFNVRRTQFLGLHGEHAAHRTRNCHRAC